MIYTILYHISNLRNIICYFHSITAINIVYRKNNYKLKVKSQTAHMSKRHLKDDLKTS